jgi:hypothetical protein
LDASALAEDADFYQRRDVMSQHPGVPADMRAAIEEFFKKAESIVSAFAGEFEKCSPPPVIYHYTNDTGLRGIIETGKLWFTDIFNLNDPSELKHGIGPALELLTAKSDAGRPEIAKFSKNLATVLQGGIEQTAHYFTCSFSAVGDDLGQWRAYADNGRGYAIGFDGAMLEQAFANAIPGPGHMTFPVRYGEEELRDMHKKIIAEVLPLISMPRERHDLESEARDEYMSELSVNLSVPILRAALFFKHKAYSNEQEYRFFQLFAANQSIPDLKYRGRPYSLTRYREFDWRCAAPESLKEIIIGPAAEKNLAVQFATDCLRAFHPTPGIVSIHPSTIPYRAP